MILCGKYIGDSDATCPQLTCIRKAGHEGLCNNVFADLPSVYKNAKLPDCEPRDAYRARTARGTIYRAILSWPGDSKGKDQ